MTESVPELTPPAPLVSRFTSVPVTIEAALWDGSQEARDAIIDWTAADGAIIDTDHIAHLWDYEIGAYKMPSGTIIRAPYNVRCLIVATLEGNMVAEPGHWIIKGTEGEFYPCKDSVFRRKYQAATDA